MGTIRAFQHQLPDTMDCALNDSDDSHESSRSSFSESAETIASLDTEPAVIARKESTLCRTNTQFSRAKHPLTRFKKSTSKERRGSRISFAEQCLSSACGVENPARKSSTKLKRASVKTPRLTQTSKPSKQTPQKESTAD